MSKKKRVIAKNTLSFACSKCMKYVRTPKDIWDDLKDEFNFTIDACASDENHLLPRYWTEKEDCLKQDWTDEVVYCHPMFDGKIGKFVEKAYKEKCVTVMLIPASVHTKYFHEFIYNNPKCEIRFLRKPVRGFNFGHEDGTYDDLKLLKRVGYIRPLMIVIFRNE